MVRPRYLNSPLYVAPSIAKAKHRKLKSLQFPRVIARLTRGDASLAQLITLFVRINQVRIDIKP